MTDAVKQLRSAAEWARGGTVVTVLFLIGNVNDHMRLSDQAKIPDSSTMATIRIAGFYFMTGLIFVLSITLYVQLGRAIRGLTAKTSSSGQAAQAADRH